MNTTGATVWDFLISMRVPIWIVLIIIILVFCISNADKLLALSGAIAGLFKTYWFFGARFAREVE